MERGTYTAASKDEASTGCISRPARVAICSDPIARSVLGEAPLWSDGSLFWVDANGCAIRRLAPDGHVVSWSFDQPVIALAATDESGWLLVVLGGALLFWSPVDDRRIAAPVTLSGWPAYRFNDAAIDANGRLWVGTMRNNIAPDGAHIDVADDDGVILRIDGDSMMAVMVTGLGCPNGLGFAPDGSKVYWANSSSNRMMVGDIDPADGRMTNAMTFDAGFARGIPDGSAVDAQGFVWNARFGGGCVVRFAPDGRVDRVIDLPVTNPTCCCFGGEDGRTLYVTSASLLAPEQDRHAGALLSFDAEVAGAPVHRFRPGPAFTKDLR